MAHAATILASTLGWDISEAREHRYQDTRTPVPIFTVGDNYFAVCKARPTFYDLAWRVHPDQFWAAKSNTVLWVAESSEVTK